MQRVNTGDGRFAAGNPATGVPGSMVTSKFMNDVQDEIVNLIENAGLTLSTSNQQQMYAAVQAVITSRFSGTNSNLANNGFQKLPGGLIIQWGNALSGEDGESIITFPTAFPTAIFRAFSAEGAGDSWLSNVAIIYGAHSVSKTGMLVRCKSITGTSGPVVAPAVVSNWLAFGN